MVQDTSGSNFYTRAGNFTFDKEGYLVNPDGHQLQGYQIDTDGNIGSISDIYIPGERVSAPAATTEFNFDINLNAGAQTGDTYTTAQTVYDSLGNAIPVTFTFTRQAAAQTWTVTGADPGERRHGCHLRRDRQHEYRFRRRRNHDFPGRQRDHGPHLDQWCRYAPVNELGLQGR